MSEYLDKLRAAAKAGSNELFYNGSPDHACDILTALFESANAEVDFVTRRLDPDVFGRPEVAGAARDFVKARKGRLRILFDDDPADCISPNHPFIAGFNASDNVQIRQISALTLSSMPYHFTVADGRAYRFEPDKVKFEAVACMNDTGHGKRFADIFNSIWDDSAQKLLPLANAA